MITLLKFEYMLLSSELIMDNFTFNWMCHMIDKGEEENFLIFGK